MRTVRTTSGTTRTCMNVTCRPAALAFARYLDNMELQRQLRMVKKEQAEFERMRAVERQQDTIKNLAKKEYVRYLPRYAVFCGDEIYSCCSMVVHCVPVSVTCPRVAALSRYFSQHHMFGQQPPLRIDKEREKRLNQDKCGWGDSRRWLGCAWPLLPAHVPTRVD